MSAPAFALLSTHCFPEYVAEGLHYRHAPTCLEVYHLACPDPENLFAFCFPTPPADSTGVAHILEHSVLCGSDAYPLPDPFIRLANQSVKTFLNAMTFPDKTVYPAASLVEADYFNLMSVYGDAVFRPLLTPATFAQEKSVVYNEMKGAYSSLETLAARHAFRSVLGGTPYEHDSGGDPAAIPTLTYDAFRAFHRAHYVPSRCLIFLYGNIDTEKQLSFIEENFLSEKDEYLAGKPPPRNAPRTCDSASHCHTSQVEPAATVYSKDIPIKNERVIDTAMDWIKNHPIGFVETVIGKVEVTANSVKASMSHYKYSNKVFVLPAIKLTLASGAYLGHAPDISGKPNENYYFAAPIELDGERKILFVRVVETKGMPQKFYVHEVFTEEEIKKSGALQTAAITKASSSGKASDLYRSILNYALFVNSNSQNSAKTYEFPAPANEDASTVLVNWFCGEVASPTGADTYMDAVFLWELLAGHDSSPLSKALIDSRLGEDMAPQSGVDCDIKYLVMTAGLRGVAREDAAKVEVAIRTCLETLLRDGIAPEDRDAAIMALDFHNREINRNGGPFSLALMRRVLRAWLYGLPPAIYVSTNDTLAAVKSRLAPDPHKYIANLIRSLLLDNPHRSLVTVYPDPEYTATPIPPPNAASENLPVAAGMAASGERTPPVEIPYVRPKDLTVTIDRIKCELGEVNGVPLFLSKEAVNRIVYVDVGFPLDGLAASDLALLPLFATALCSTGFAGLPWAECSRRIAGTTGGFGAHCFSGAALSSEWPASWLFLRVKMLAEKTGDALALLADALLTTDFTEQGRIQDLLLEARNDLRASLVPAGHEYAMSRTSRFFHPSKNIDETWNGTDQLATLQSLVDTGDTSTLAARFRRLRTALVSPASTPIIHVTTDTDPSFLTPKLEQFVTKVGFRAVGPAIFSQWQDETVRCTAEWERLGRQESGKIGSSPPGVSAMEGANGWPSQHNVDGQLPEIIPLEAQVGFAAASFRCSPYGTKESAHEAVLSHWLSGNLLWDKLRVKGGAYGAFAVNEPLEQVFSLATYRDPTPRASLSGFRTCLGEAASYPFDAAAVERTVTGAYSREVQPRSPQSRGFTGFVRRLYGITDELREAKIAALLACTGADLNAAAERLLSYRDQECHEAILGQSEA